MAEHRGGAAASRPESPGPDDDGDDTGSEEPGSPPTSPAVERKRRSPLVLVGEIGGAISALAAVVGLVLVFAPGLKPDPPAAVKGAAFSGVTTDVNISRAGYLQRLD